EGPDDQLEHVRRLAVETELAHLLDDTRPLVAHERDVPRVLGLLGEDLPGETLRFRDAAPEAFEARVQAGAIGAAARDHVRERLTRIRCARDTLEQRVLGGARRPDLAMRRVERGDEGGEILPNALDLRRDAVLRQMDIEWQRARAQQ